MVATTFSNSLHAIEVDVGLETSLCESIKSLIPKQKGFSLWVDTEVTQFTDISDWSDYEEYCFIKEDTYDYDNIDIEIFSEKYLSGEDSEYSVPLHVSLRASIRCLFTSQYEWECLFSDATKFDAKFLRYVVIQPSASFYDTTYFSNTTPNIILENTRKKIESSL
ncbi:hypothetical protein [Bermanella sp. R86510]|uniref:hypothetical protein n=1 Tax=unclassified Bermanella TaxID=2627862 RepID=UPI0037CBC076